MTSAELTVIPAGARVFIYGSGSAGKSLYMWLNKSRSDVKILGFIDSFKSGRCAGKYISRIDDFPLRFSPLEYDLILIASGASKDIADRLKRMNIHAFIILSIPSYLMENLIPPTLRERLAAFLISLFALFFPRRKHLFFGEHGGKFIGNNKYFYLFLREQGECPVLWAAEDPSICLELEEEGIRTLQFRPGGLRSLLTLFTASHFYFDNMTWQRKYPWLRHFKAHIIHMSHGVGLKLTEKMLIPRDFLAALSLEECKKLDDKIFRNDLLVSTSAFYAEKVSCPAYNTPPEKISLCGYPKNDLFYRDIPGARIFTGSGLLENLRVMKTQGFSIIAYTPTFRDMDAHFRHAAALDFPELDLFLEQHRMVMVIKGHTSAGEVRGGEGRTHFSHILVYPGDRDGYPLLKEVDLLITDYSSIYMDFLHSRKPMIFFIHDYEEYISRHREIQFDYETMTPGPKARNQDELNRWIYHFLIKKRDGFQFRRDKIMELAFAYADGNAGRRLLMEMKQRRLYP